MVDPSLRSIKLTTLYVCEIIKYKLFSWLLVNDLLAEIPHVPLTLLLREELFFMPIEHWFMGIFFSLIAATPILVNNYPLPMSCSHLFVQYYRRSSFGYWHNIWWISWSSKVQVWETPNSALSWRFERNPIESFSFWHLGIAWLF